jgi:hypothetical protein
VLGCHGLRCLSLITSVLNTGSCTVSDVTARVPWAYYGFEGGAGQGKEFVLGTAWVRNRPYQVTRGPRTGVVREGRWGGDKFSE